MEGKGIFGAERTAPFPLPRLRLPKARGSLQVRELNRQLPACHYRCSTPAFLVTGLKTSAVQGSSLTPRPRRLCVVKPTLCSKFGELRAVRAPGPCPAPRPHSSAPSRVKERGRGEKTTAHCGALTAFTQRCVYPSPLPPPSSHHQWARQVCLVLRSLLEPIGKDRVFLKGTATLDFGSMAHLGGQKVLSQSHLCSLSHSCSPQNKPICLPSFLWISGLYRDKVLRSDLELVIYI